MTFWKKPDETFFPTAFCTRPKSCLSTIIGLFLIPPNLFSWLFAKKKRKKKKERRGKNKILPKRKREEEEKKSEKSQRNTKFPSSLTKEASSNESILLVQFRESEGPFSLSLSPSLSLPPVTKRNQLSRWAVFNRHSAWFELNFLLDSLILSINRWAGNPVERERPETTIYIYTHTHTHAHIYIYIQGEAMYRNV